LSHQPFTRLFPELERYIIFQNPNGVTHIIIQLILLGATIACAYLASDLLRRFDQSEFPAKIIDQCLPVFNYLFKPFKNL